MLRMQFLNYPRVLDGTNSCAACKELLRVLKHVMDTKTLSLKFHPKKQEGKFTVGYCRVYSDSDFTGDSETRISEAGFMLYLMMGAPICWKSKGH